MIQSKSIKSPQLVLVVDDQEINRDVLGMMLEDYYDILYASDGKEALQKIEENQDRLSVVLLDLIMPEMDGFEVMSRVNGSEQLKRIPIIGIDDESTLIELIMMLLQPGHARWQVHVFRSDKDPFQVLISDQMIFKLCSSFHSSFRVVLRNELLLMLEFDPGFLPLEKTHRRVL